jgi:hypothetical protein
MTKTMPRSITNRLVTYLSTLPPLRLSRTILNTRGCQLSREMPARREWLVDVLDARRLLLGGVIEGWSMHPIELFVLLRW